MTCKANINFQNGIYHIYNRGVNKQNIFCDDEDRWCFINLCKKAKLKYEIVFLAFCLMGNHYHLFVHTPQANLSQVMKYINESFSKYFITKYKSHKKSGHTFMGPYGRRIVQTDLYASTLLAYIHNNPLKDGFVEHPADYKWSSYNYYAEGRDQFNFINKDLLADKFVPLMRGENNKAIIDPELLDWEPDDHTFASLFLGDKKFVVDIFENNLKDKSCFAESSLFKLKQQMSSHKMRKFVNSLDLNPKLHRDILIYALLRWTELQPADLAAEFGMVSSSLRRIKSTVNKKIDTGNKNYVDVIDQLQHIANCNYIEK